MNIGHEITKIVDGLLKPLDKLVEMAWNKHWIFFAVAGAVIVFFALWVFFMLKIFGVI